MNTPVLAYLDAGTGAAIAAVVASGTVGLRAVFGNARSKFGRKKGASVEPDAATGEFEAVEASPQA